MTEIKSTLADWIPKSSEFWAAILGALVGGLITFFVERQRIQASTKQEWRRIQDEDLRAFQKAVLTAMDTLEIDLGTAHRIGLNNLAAEKWTPTESHFALQDAKMLRTRLRDEQVRTEWAKLQALLMQSKEELQTAMAAADPENPLLQLVSPEAREIVRQEAPQVLDHAFLSAFRARTSSDQL